MRVVVTGGAGFIGRAVVRRLREVGHDVRGIVRQPGRAAHLEVNGARLVRGDLSSVPELVDQLADAEGLVHAAGAYRIGIAESERAGMWDANVGVTERVLQAASRAGIQRIVYVSTNNVYGDTHGLIVDESYRRSIGDGFLSVYDESKYRAHELAASAASDGAPVVIAQPGGTYGPHDHSAAGEQLALAHAGRLRFVAFGDAGLAWVHVDDVAAGIVAALDRGRIGEVYSLGGECLRLREVIALAARVGGRRPPRFGLPTALVRIAAPFSGIGRPRGSEVNLREVIRASDGVTYWASHEKAGRELGFDPRPLGAGLRDWLGGPAG